jgi:hypothetical protein
VSFSLAENERDKRGEIGFQTRRGREHERERERGGEGERERPSERENE